MTIGLILVTVAASLAFFGFMYRAEARAYAAFQAGTPQGDAIAGLVRELGTWAFYPDWRATYTWFTSAFLHGNFMHLLTNMVFLWLFGSVVEEAVGRWRFLLLYVAGAAASAALYGVTEVLMPGDPRVSLGASGALAAIMGIAAVRFHSAKLKFAYLIFIRAGTFETTAAWGVAMWGLGELAYGALQFGGMDSGTAHWAHLGGLAFGVTAAFALGFLRDASREYLLDDVALFEAAGAHDLAAAKYAAIAKGDPDNPFWLLAQARETLLSGRGELATAEGQYIRAMELLLRQDRKVEALEAFEQLSTSQVAEPARVLLAVGAAAESCARADLAAKAYAEVVQDHAAGREVEKAMFRLAHVYLGAGMYEEAASWWKAFEQRYPGSEFLPFADGAFTRPLA